MRRSARSPGTASLPSPSSLGLPSASSLGLPSPSSLGLRAPSERPHSVSSGTSCSCSSRRRRSGRARATPTFGASTPRRMHAATAAMHPAAAAMRRRPSLPPPPHSCRRAAAAARPALAAGSTLIASDSFYSFIPSDSLRSPPIPSDLVAGSTRRSTSSSASLSTSARPTRCSLRTRAAPAATPSYRRELPRFPSISHRSPIDLPS